MQGSRIQTGVLAWIMPHTREEISGPHMGSMLARYWLVHVRYSPCSPYCWSLYLSLAWLSCLPFSLLTVSSPQSLMHSLPFSLSPSRHHIIHISILSSFTVSFLFICLRYNIYISWGWLNNNLLSNFPSHCLLWSHLCTMNIERVC